MYNRIIFFAIIFLVSVNKVLGNQVINSLPMVLTHFQMKDPHVLFSTLQKCQKVNILRQLSQYGIKMTAKRSQKASNHPIVIFSNEIHTLNISSRLKHGLVISKIQDQADLNHVDLSIGSEVYFMDKASLKVYESYKINSHLVTRYLGYFNRNLTFISVGNISSSYIKRRSNFHGIQFKAMVDFQEPNVNEFAKDLEKFAPFYAKNDTFDVTDVASGVYIDVLRSIQTSLNFSTKLYKRKDGEWGVPKMLANGSYTFYGMLQSLMDQEIDFIWASFSMTPERQDFVEFLQPLDQNYGAIFIPLQDRLETIDWHAYLGPFSNHVWLTIIGASVMLTLTKLSINWLHSKTKPVRFPATLYVCKYLHSSHYMKCLISDHF